MKQLKVSVAKLTKDQMKAKVLAWIEMLKSEDLKMRKECGLSEKYEYGEFSSFKIEDHEIKGGAKGFLFCFDANIHDIIDGYRADGFSTKQGAAFDALTDGTNWSQEAQNSCVEFFYVSF